MMSHVNKGRKLAIELRSVSPYLVHIAILLATQLDRYYGIRPARARYPYKKCWPLVQKTRAFGRNRLPQVLRKFCCIFWAPTYTVRKSHAQAESFFNFILATFFRNVPKYFN
jgi:hypothetical protein